MTARQFGIVTTSFAGTGDKETNAYNGKRIDPSKPGVALPFRFRGALPRVRVFHGDKSVVCDVVDVGPHHTNDDYWNEIGGRPRAEREHGNKAGLDMTPAGWIALGIGPGHAQYGETKLDWQLEPEEPHVREV